MDPNRILIDANEGANQMCFYEMNDKERFELQIHSYV